jgi:sugar phosphate isomerase/epimerase
MNVSVNPMAMLGRPYDEEYAALVSAGATSIGLAARKLDALGWDEGVEGALAAGLSVDYMVVGLLAPPVDPAAWEAEGDLLRRAVATTAAVGGHSVYFCSGAPGPVRYEEAATALVERLTPLAMQSADVGVRLLLENSLSSRSDCSFVFTLSDALTIAERAGIGVCADLYCCWMEPGLAGTLQRAASGGRLGMVQISDRCLSSLAQPDRRVPGDGDLPLAQLVADVRVAGYDGPLDLELLGPEIEREGPGAAVARGLAWLRAALSRC